MFYSSSGKCVWTTRKSGTLLCLSVDDEPENSLITLHSPLVEGLKKWKSRSIDFSSKKPCRPLTSSHFQRIPASNELQKINALCAALMNLSHTEVQRICGFPDFVIGDKHSGLWGYQTDSYKELCIIFERGNFTGAHWTPEQREAGKYIENCVSPNTEVTEIFANNCKYRLISEGNKCQFIIESYESDFENIHAVYWTPDQDQDALYEYNIPLDFFRIP